MADLVAGRPINAKTEPKNHEYGLMSSVRKFRGWEQSAKALAEIRVFRTVSAAETIALTMATDPDIARVDTHSWMESLN
jgi:hypothetical protein